MENPKEIIKGLIEKNQKRKEEKERVRQEKIERTREKQRELYINKPRYKIEDLYVGKIIYIQSEKFYSGPTHSIFDSGTWITFKNIKKFAIFYNPGPWIDDIHVVTNHTLKTSLWAKPGEYCIHYDSMMKFDKALQRFMIENRLNRNSMLSIKQITELENNVNELNFPDQRKDDLFWGN